MNTRSFAQSISKLQPSSRFQPDRLITRLTYSSVAALQAWWQAETDRRRRLNHARELDKMSVHTLRDIGVSRSATDWIERHDS